MDVYRAVRPLLFALPAESAHTAVHRLLGATQGTPLEQVLARHYQVNDARLRVSVFGEEFPNPVGVAAGFDKNARIPRALGNLGFGHVEIGGVTATAQPGNPRPRLFRLVEDRALINRMGFNNDGADVVADRLASSAAIPIPLGINIGLSKSTDLEDAPADYRYTYRQLAASGDYFVINVSSPNTPGLRDLQATSPLERIIAALQDAGAAPLLVKLSPDLDHPTITQIISLAEERGLAGLIAVNTTVDRPASLHSEHQTQDGGLSGKPLESRATDVIRTAARQTDLPIIGVGGVFTAEDAYAKIRAGASLIQLYTGLVYRGPAIARAINTGLLDCLERDGYGSIQAAIGSDLA